MVISPIRIVSSCACGGQYSTKYPKGALLQVSEFLSFCTYLSPVWCSVLWIVPLLVSPDSWLCLLHLTNALLPTWVPLSVLWPGNALNAIVWDNCKAYYESLSLVVLCSVSWKVLIHIFCPFFCLFLVERVNFIPITLGWKQKFPHSLLKYNIYMVVIRVYVSFHGQINIIVETDSFHISSFHNCHLVAAKYSTVCQIYLRPIYTLKDDLCSTSFQKRMAYW